MTYNDKPLDNIFFELQERNKELNCIYSIEEALNKGVMNFEEAFDYVINTIPPGWQYPNICVVKLIFDNKVYTSKSFVETPWVLSANIVIQDKIVGKISVYYKKEMPRIDIGPFLKEEEKLLRTIADRVGHFILHNRLRDVFDEIQTVKTVKKRGDGRAEWRVILDMLRKTDPKLFYSVLRKLLHQLLWQGVEGADRLEELSSIDDQVGNVNIKLDENRPLPRRIINNYDEYIYAILKLVEENLPDDQILAKIQKWIQEAKATGLVKAVESLDASLGDISDAIRKYFHLAPEKFELSESTTKGLRVSLIRRFFTDQLDYIKIAKEYVKLTDFYSLINRMIFHSKSHGKLGGKSAGLFLANNIIQKCCEVDELLKDIKTPKTWFVASDGVMHFLHYNDNEDVLAQKNKDLDEIRIEYPHIVQMFKNSQFPPDMIKGLSLALDDFEDKPLVVRSSSLMEDQMGQSFSGKYKSLFLANQGTKKERLVALMDAIAEVYASIFGPDPIEYRAERGLIDFHEEMGIMIQEVVGTKVGDYFLPAFAGVAFSNNEFRWSSRIRREDGLIRIVPGLGTRAVDRLSDDYPILVAPGQPNLRVNITIEEMVRYSPKKVDVINLKTNQFETIEYRDLLHQYGDSCPMVQSLVSKFDGVMVRPVGFDTDYKKDDLIVTLEGLLSKTNFVKKVNHILKTLQDKIKSPVDLEFAHDGKNFYLLQCRPQSYFSEITSDPIPKNLPEDSILFSANRYVSNGKIADITHIVYVDPFEYSMLPDVEKMKEVGKAVSKLNKMLPKRQFILMGPGRWGSRGDIKLGVSVTYSDINNTSMLIEIARKKGNYVPDLSFGTHFFQDLVEASIQYLPLYPDDPGIIFNDRFFNVAANNLAELAPEFAHLVNVLKVIDVPKATNGHVLRVLLNADLDEALGVIAEPSVDEISSINVQIKPMAQTLKKDNSDQWRWRLGMAEKIAQEIDTKKFGVKDAYVFGSTKNANAASGSDIDLIFHVEDDKQKMEALKNWLDGWSLCLSEINYSRTGYKTQGLLDVHFITDEDIKNNNSYASKINAVTDPAKKLKINKTED